MILEYVKLDMVNFLISNGSKWMFEELVCLLDVDEVYVMWFVIVI